MGPAHLKGTFGSALTLVLILLIAPALAAQAVDPVADMTLEESPTTQPAHSGELKKMSLDELMNLEVTLVSKRPEKLNETPSAITVITNEDIRRSGALSLPEALRLAPNLMVAQLDGHDWAITARGFNGAPAANNAFSDKLLVMIDGRTIYSPLFAGVFWDVQNVLLEDVDRIEVISGPGGTLWGANAVNGVINIVTKSARDTQGLYLSGAGGSFWQQYGAFRYGGKIGQNLYYRVYGLGFQHAHTDLPTGANSNDNWDLQQTGFRLDYYPESDNTFTFQGDIYQGNLGEPLPLGQAPTDYQNVDGGNLLGRWTHVFSEKSDFTLQFYFDNAGRHLPVADFGYVTRTYDVDFQHRFPLGDRNSILWGIGYRVIIDNENNSPQLSFFPAKRNLELFSGFLQDEITLVPDRLKLTIGSKLEHNDYSGFEIQPSARIAWTPTDRQTIWAAVSRAVRSPTRFDSDVFNPLIASNGDFKSEKELAYEIGYRVRPIEPLSLSISAFYNRYDDLRSFDFNPAAPPTFVFGNDQEAESWGAELSGNLQLAEWWRVRGGYTYFDKNVWQTSALVAPGADTFEGNDPNNQVILQSMMDLPGNFQLDVVGRYVDALPAPAVSAYFSADVRFAWHYRNWELAVVGQNLLDDQHPEFGTRQIPRSVYGQVTFRW